MREAIKTPLSRNRRKFQVSTSSSNGRRQQKVIVQLIMVLENQIAPRVGWWCNAWANYECENMKIIRLTCTVWPSADRLVVGCRRHDPLMRLQVEVDDLRTVDLILRVIRWVNVTSSTENVHPVVYHSCGMKVAIRWRRSKAVRKSL